MQTHDALTNITMLGGPAVGARSHHLLGRYCVWHRPRRSNLAAPGSNHAFWRRAKGLPADQGFLDLEDACAPLAKPSAPKNIVAALNEGSWGDKMRVARVNDWTTL
jgi:citrate lyase subunit beta/citryl-CoA lyase